MSPDGKNLSVYLERASSDTEMHPWRWGFIQTNGKDKSDPKYEEFPLIGPNGLALDKPGPAGHRHLGGPLDRPGREERQAHRAGRQLGGQAVRRHQRSSSSPRTARSGSPTPTAACGCARRTRTRSSTSTASTGGRTASCRWLVKDMPNTNGLAFSPDEKILYVNGSRDRYVKAYDVKADGTLANGRMLIDMHEDPAQAASPTACGSTSRATCGRPARAACGSSRRRASTSAPSRRRSCPPTSSSATATTRRSTSRRAPASTRSASTWKASRRGVGFSASCEERTVSRSPEIAA